MTIQIEDTAELRRIKAAEFFTPQGHRIFRSLGILSTVALVLVTIVCSYRMGYARGVSDARPIVVEARGLYRWLTVEASRANDAEQRPGTAPSLLAKSVPASQVGSQ